jgi:hypothetical protein
MVITLQILIFLNFILYNKKEIDNKYFEMILFGLKWFIQNVYQFEVTAIDPFKQRETWIFVHAWVPMLIRLIVPNFWYSVGLCYGWETFECSFFILVEFAKYYPDNSFSAFAHWLGGEMPTDSLIGDISQGLIAALWCSYFLKWSGIENGSVFSIENKNPIWSSKTRGQKLKRIILIVFVALSALIATIQATPDPNRPLYPSTWQQFVDEPWNMYPIGWYVYIPIQIFFVWVFYNLDLEEYHDKISIRQLYEMIIIYFGINAIITTPFFIPTYYTYWATIPFLCYFYNFILQSPIQNKMWIE